MPTAAYILSARDQKLQYSFIVLNPLKIIYLASVMV